MDWIQMGNKYGMVGLSTVVMPLIMEGIQQGLTEFAQG